MSYTPLQVDAEEIKDHQALDPITVFWIDYSPGVGMVTIVCYGVAWNGFWAGMGKDRGVRKFFAECGNDYLINRMANHQFMKMNKQQQKYLGRIIDAIKAELKETHGYGRFTTDSAGETAADPS